MRYLVVEKELGLFLGVYQGIFIFAKNNVFPIIKSPGFDSEEDAEYYIGKYFPKKDKTYGVICIETKSRYVNIVDVIKSGYKEYVHDLVNFIPMYSEAIH
jgi:hypothetical protein